MMDIHPLSMHKRKRRRKIKNKNMNTTKNINHEIILIMNIK